MFINSLNRRGKPQHHMISFVIKPLTVSSLVQLPLKKGEKKEVFLSILSIYHMLGTTPSILHSFACLALQQPRKADEIDKITLPTLQVKRKRKCQKPQEIIRDEIRGMAPRLQRLSRRWMSSLHLSFTFAKLKSRHSVFSQVSSSSIIFMSWCSQGYGDTQYILKNTEKEAS